MSARAWRKRFTRRAATPARYDWMRDLEVTVAPLPMAEWPPALADCLARYRDSLTTAEHLRDDVPFERSPLEVALSRAAEIATTASAEPQRVNVPATPVRPSTAFWGPA